MLYLSRLRRRTKETISRIINSVTSCSPFIALLPLSFKVSNPSSLEGFPFSETFKSYDASSKKFRDFGRTHAPRLFENISRKIKYAVQLVTVGHFVAKVNFMYIRIQHLFAVDITKRGTLVKKRHMENMI